LFKDILFRPYSSSPFAKLQAIYAIQENFKEKLRANLCVYVPYVVKKTINTLFFLIARILSHATILKDIIDF